MCNNQAWIQTFTGKKFYPLDPRPEDIDILDIAHGLSMICRFNGQCKRFYSVAEHSVLMTKYMLAFVCWGTLKQVETAQLLTLLHDAPEAYISDVGKPIKPLLTGYNDVEYVLQCAVNSRFGITKEDELIWGQALKDIDSRILIDEQRQLMPNPPDKWGHVGEPLGVTIECWSPARAEREFLEMFYSLYEGE
jgi:hypothetical protein